MEPSAFNPRAQAAQALLGGMEQAQPRLSALDELQKKRKQEAEAAMSKGGGLLGTALGAFLGSAAGPAGMGAGASLGESLGSQAGGMFGGAL